MEEEFLYEDIPYFEVPSGVIVDIGDDYSAKSISFPYYCWKNKWLVNCIINSKYERVMKLNVILKQAEIVIQYYAHIKKSGFNLLDRNTKKHLNSYINEYKETFKSSYNISDILLYLDPPKFISEKYGQLLQVTDIFEVRTFACLSHTVLVTKVKHLDASANIPELIDHLHFRRGGTLLESNLKLLMSSAECNELNDSAIKYKSLLLMKDHYYIELKERYSNRVKVSQQTVKGIYKKFHCLLKEKLIVKNIGKIAKVRFPLAKATFKYILKTDMNLSNWIKCKRNEYHKLTLSELSTISSIEATTAKLSGAITADEQKQIDECKDAGDNDINANDGNQNPPERLLTFESCRISYDWFKRDIIIMGNVVRVDLTNESVIGSIKRKKEEKRKKLKEKRAKERKAKKNKNKNKDNC